MDNARLYVGNLSFSTTEASLRALFEARGSTVQSVSVVSDRETGKPRGFAFVEMSSRADALQALTSLNGTELDGRQINLSEARERSNPKSTNAGR